MDYEEDEPLDPLPAGWLEEAAEGAGAQKVPRTHASPLLSAESCNRLFQGSDARAMRGEGGCDDGGTVETHIFPLVLPVADCVTQIL